MMTALIVISLISLFGILMSLFLILSVLSVLDDVVKRADNHHHAMVNFFLQYSKDHANQQRVNKNTAERDRVVRMKLTELEKVKSKKK